MPPFVIVLLIIALIIFLIVYLRNPFKSYETPTFILDITGRGTMDRDDYIDIAIIEDQAIPVMINSGIICYNNYIEEMSNKYKNNKHRLKQLDKIKQTLNHNAYIRIERKQTRYRQVNYVRYPYTTTVLVEIIPTTLEETDAIYNELLLSSDFTLTRKQYNSKNQRKLMTKDLRLQVKLRDNYTCQCCGKHMPDEVGLHIDHIIPVTKGGKSVLSNLQVLCDKCNLKKGNK